MFRNLRFYRITNPWPKTEQKLSEVLSENAFSPCGAFSERSAGWEAPAIYDDAPLCRRLHGADLLQLRTQSRVLPVAAIKDAQEEKCKELLTIFSGIPTCIGGLFLTADATLASPEPPESSPARQLQALPTTRDDSIPAS